MPNKYWTCERQVNEQIGYVFSLKNRFMVIGRRWLHCVQYFSSHNVDAAAPTMIRLKFSSQWLEQKFVAWRASSMPSSEIVIWQ